MLTSYDLCGESFHQTTTDVDTIKGLVTMLPQNPILINIGACFGTSAIAMLEARPDAFIFSIDVSPSPKEIEHLRQAGLYDLNRVIRCLGHSQDIGRHWPGQVDFIYVDGAHGYSDVVEDIELWRRVIKPGGIMLIHDYGKPMLPDVKRAVDDTMFGYKHLLTADSMIAFRI